jgi:biotin transport system substrate-specific component
LLMHPTFSLTYPLKSILWSKRSQKALYNSLLVILGSLFLAVASQIAIPLQPVPITLQSFAVLLLGMTYGWRLGSCAVLLFLLEGAVGIPVFSEFKAGIPVLFGVTGGYLLGFLPAAFVSGLLVEKGWGKNVISTACATLVGFGIIYICGLAGLAAYIGWQPAINAGLIPFLLGDSIKLLALAAIVPLFWKKKAN